MIPFVIRRDGSTPFVIRLQDAERLAPLIDAANAAAGRAEAAADGIEGIAAGIIPQGTATATANTSAETIYAVTLPAGYDPAPNGQTFSFIVPATSASSTIRLLLNGNTQRDVFMQIGQPLREGWVATFRSNVGGQKWDLVSQVPNGLSLLEVERTADAALTTSFLTTGADAILQPVNGNPNELYADVTKPGNDGFFWAYVVAENTQAYPIINTRDGQRFAVDLVQVGDWKPRDLVRIVFSAGINNYIWRETKRLPTLAELADDGAGPDLVAKFVRDFHAAQWATGGAQPVPFAITTAGSSVTTEISSGRAGATDYAPSHRMVDLLNGYTGSPSGIPAGARVPGTKVIDDNWSHGGHSISQFASQIYESPYWQAGTTRALMLNPGPNDFRISNYNAGQTLPGAATVLESLIGLAIDRGIPVFMTTPFDPDVSQEDYDSFFGDNPGIAQSYPYPVTAPTDPETEQYPPAPQSSGTADMTGRGIPIPFDRRFEHGAMIVRALAAKYPKVVVLIDSRKAYHRAVEALQPNAYQKRILYTTGDPIHPQRYAHDRGFGIPIDELAQDILAARPLERVYEGRDSANYGG